MQDPFNILGAEFDVPPTFAEAVRNALDRFQDAHRRFEERADGLTDDSLTDEEWAVVEHTILEMEAAAERCEEGYVAVQYDGHAWYRIIENLEQVTLRLESAISLIDAAAQR